MVLSDYKIPVGADCADRTWPLQQEFARYSRCGTRHSQTNPVDLEGVSPLAPSCSQSPIAFLQSSRGPSPCQRQLEEPLHFVASSSDLLKCETSTRLPADFVKKLSVSAQVFFRCDREPQSFRRSHPPRVQFSILFGNNHAFQSNQHPCNVHYRGMNEPDTPVIYIAGVLALRIGFGWKPGILLLRIRVVAGRGVSEVGNEVVRMATALFAGC